MKPDISASRKHLTVLYAEMIDMPVLFVARQHSLMQFAPELGSVLGVLG